jgi:hypothetical protein
MDWSHVVAFLLGAAAAVLWLIFLAWLDKPEIGDDDDE